MFRPVAQLVEHRSPKPAVGGSIPSWPANNGLQICKNCDQEAATKSSLFITTFSVND